MLTVLEATMCAEGRDILKKAYQSQIGSQPARSICLEFLEARFTTSEGGAAYAAREKSN